MNKNYNILGLCKRANKLRQGTDTLNFLLEKKEVVLVIFSNKIATGTKVKIVKKLNHLNIDYIEIDHEILNKQIGAQNAKVVSCIDLGFKIQILKLIE